MEKLKNSLKSSDKNILTLLVIAVGIVAIMTAMSPEFLSKTNISAMAFQFPEFGILMNLPLRCRREHIQFPWLSKPGH
jgi:ribose/xylose/arabinose/galactoside ABC-type transport system permease subunit